MNAMIDVSKALAAKSDQLNAEDLLVGPRTIRIRDVSETKDDKGNVKLKIAFDGDNGKPWILSKTSARILSACWGLNAAKWIGLSCTVYNDESVVFGGAKVGGIRVSHAEGITAPRTFNLTVTRGKKKEHVIQPLVVERKTKADAWRERLLAVAADPDKEVAAAWAKVPDEIRTQLGAGFHDQLLQIEGAAVEHAQSDDAVLADLNGQLAAE